MAIPVFDLSQVTGIRKNSTTPPLISTRAGLIDGARPGGGDPTPGDETLFWELTFTDGLPNNIGAGNAHPGGGYISFEGNPVSTGISNTNIFHDTVTDDPLFPGTVEVLRDTYFSNPALYSFTNQTMYINHPETQRFYMRMRVKWSSNWQWGNDQLKFCKNKGPVGTTTNCPKFTGDTMGITKLYSTDGGYDLNVHAQRDFPDFANIEDDINNSFGAGSTDANFTPVNNQWYWVEWEIDAGTPGVADGFYRIWIDGNLYMSLDNTLVRKVGHSGFDYHELGHVWEDGTPTEDISMYWHSVAVYDKRPATLPEGIA